MKYQYISNPIKILVKYKGHFKKVIGLGHEYYNFNENIKLEKLIELLKEKYPLFKNEETFLITINGKFIFFGIIHKTFIKDGDEVEIFPTVTGG